MSKQKGGIGRDGNTVSTGRYRGTAGGIRNVIIGGGTTHHPKYIDRIMSRGLGRQTGGRFSNPAHEGHRMKNSSKLGRQGGAY